MNLARRLLIFLFLAAIESCSLWAQTTSSLRGQVTDPSGAAIPNATVTVSGPANTVKVGTSDASGNYTIVGLPAGPYTVRAFATGFTLFEKTALDLAAGRPTTLDVPLSIATEKQEVTVADTQQIAIPIRTRKRRRFGAERRGSRHSSRRSLRSSGRLARTRLTRCRTQRRPDLRGRIQQRPAPAQRLHPRDPDQLQSFHLGRIRYAGFRQLRGKFFVWVRARTRCTVR